MRNAARVSEFDELSRRIERRGYVARSVSFPTAGRNTEIPWGPAGSRRELLAECSVRRLHAALVATSAGERYGSYARSVISRR